MATVTKKSQDQAFDEKLEFDEWEVRRVQHPSVDGKSKVEFEKIKLLRKKVRITKGQANTLNEGRKTMASNTYFVMYLLPDESIEPIYLTYSRA